MGNSDIDLNCDAYFDGRTARRQNEAQSTNPFPDGTSENRFWNNGWLAADWRYGEGGIQLPEHHLNPALMVGTSYIPKEPRFESEEDPWCHSCDHAIHDCRCDG